MWGVKVACLALAPPLQKDQSVRPIVFDHKVYGTTWQTIDALAWATVRRGRNAWKSENVVQTIRAYLLDHGAHPDIYPASRITSVMRTLDDEGFATLISSEGRRYIKFEFLPDVDLLRPTPEFVGKKSTVSPEDIETDVLIQEDELGLPIPQVKPDRYLAGEINSLLDKFADLKPEAYAQYAERLVAGLKTVL
jgi:hypothetical protein